MSKVGSRVADWLSGVSEPGETLRSWSLLNSKVATPESSGSGRPMDEHVAALGLDPAAEVGQGHMQLLATLTDQRLLFASVGFVSVKPKQLVIEAPIESVRLEWWDRANLGPDRRWLLFLMGDRWLRHSSMIDKNSNTDEFVATLGERAVRVR